MRTRIKICGITNVDDALAACELGADAIGLVFADSPRKITHDQAAGITRELPPFVKAVGVFTAEDKRISTVFDVLCLDLIQLHGDQSEQFAAWIGSYRVIRAIRIKDKSSLEEVRNRQIGAAYLLDAWAGHCKGGTGITFNWELAVKVKEIGKPVILAGGLNPENVADAIRTVRPYAVDVSSGVEKSPGKKDYEKMKEFIANVRAADETA